MEKCRVLVKWGKKAVEIACNIACYFEKMFVSRERNYPEVIYYNISKTASELLYEWFDFHLWLVYFFQWSTSGREWENGFQTCMVSSRGWHGSLSSTIYCSKVWMLHLLCKPSFISCPGHLELYQSYRFPKYEHPGPLSLHCHCSPSSYSFHHRLFRQGVS